MPKDNLIPLSRFRADLARALARRGKALLEANNLAEAVAALTPLEAYFVIKELGIFDAVPVLKHVTAEQLQAFVDLDCWSGDEPRLQGLDVWLAPFAASGPQALLDAFLRLDDEMQVLYIAESVRVYDARSEEVPEPTPGVPRAETPDTFFAIEAVPNPNRQLDPLVLVDALYRHSVNEAFRLLMAAKWEARAELEEQAFRFRSARIEELGFPPREEALKLFTPPPKSPPAVASVTPSAAPSQLPALYAAPLSEASLLSRALGRVTEAALLERIERELVCLVNSSVVAFGEAPNDVAHVIEIATRVRDTLSLGIEALLPKDVLTEADTDAAETQAAEILSRWPVVEVFRHGHAEALMLQREAFELAQRPHVKAWLDAADAEEHAADEADRAFVHALLSRPPLHAGFDPLQLRRRRAFASKAELARARERLSGIATRLGC